MVRKKSHMVMSVSEGVRIIGKHRMVHEDSCRLMPNAHGLWENGPKPQKF